MPSKDARKKELQKQYEEELAKIEEDAEDDNADEDDIIILRGNARRQVLKALERAGFTDDEAEEVIEDAEENADVDEEKETPKGKGKDTKKSVKDEKIEDEDGEDVKDTPPPPRNRYFGGRH